MEHSVIFNPAETIHYAAGSVVSKTIIKNASGNVTLFAFDTGEGLSEHTAPFDALVLLLDGMADIMIGGKSFLLQKGESVIMPAGVPHSLKAHQPFKMMLTMIKDKLSS